MHEYNFLVSSSEQKSDKNEIDEDYFLEKRERMTVISNWTTLVSRI